MKKKGTLFGKPSSSVVKRPGAFTAKAKRAGRGVQEHARYVLAHPDSFDTRTKRQAALARRFKKGLSKKARP